MNFGYEHDVPQAQKRLILFYVHVYFPDRRWEFIIRCVHSFEDIYRSQETSVQS